MRLCVCVSATSFFTYNIFKHSLRKYFGEKEAFLFFLEKSISVEQQKYLKCRLVKRLSTGKDEGHNKNLFFTEVSVLSFNFKFLERRQNFTNKITKKDETLRKNYKNSFKKTKFCYFF